MNKLRNLLRPKVVLSGLFAAVVLVLGMGVVSQPTTAATCPGHDNDDNAVIRCGYTDLNNLGSKIASDPHHDVTTLYAHWGYTDFNTFKANAKHVTVYKNTGEVKLDDGTVVAKNTQSLGRLPITGNNHNLKIGNTTYYYGPVQGNFGSSSLDGYAQFNPDDHSMMFGSLSACANPFWGNSPGYKCKMLTQTKVNSTTYKYLATPYVHDGATISRIVYDFGDGHSKEVTSNFDQAVTYSYPVPGDYTARATVYFMVNGKEKSDTRQECTKPVSIPKPKAVFYCTELIGKQVTGSRTKFTFTAKSHTENGANLQSVTFKYDDGTSKTVNATNGSATDTHEYTKEGFHTTKADMTFNVGSDKNNPKCVAKTKTNPPSCKDTPNKPECQTCETNPEKPECRTCTNTPTLPGCTTCENTPDAPDCKTCATHPDMPECKELPKTGPEDFVGTFLGLSSITGAGAYYHLSRRNLLARLK